jgi:hypothetical protein
LSLKLTFQIIFIREQLFICKIDGGDTMAIENNQYNFNNYFVADVLNIDFTNRRLAVYIPKLMPGVAGNQEISAQIQTSNNPNVSGLQSFNNVISTKNSIWVFPWDFKEPLPKIGSKVAVFFLEGNPKTGYWQLFNPNNNYEVIDEEKFPKLLNLSFASSNIQLDTDDSIEIVFPESYSSVLNQNGKTKKIELFDERNYVIQTVQPDNPFDGLMWFNPENQEVYVYRNAQFKKVIFEEDLQYLYEQVEILSRTLEDQVLSSRLLFASSLSRIVDPIEGQIVVIDSTKSENGFFKYTILESEETLQKEGYYFLKYANLMKQYVFENEITLKAYKYVDGKWFELDGWFAFTQPAGDLGGLKQNHNQTVNTTVTLTWDFRTQLSDSELELKLYSIKFDGISIVPQSGTEGEVTLRFYSGTDYATGTKIGTEFTLILADGEISLSPEVFQSTYLEDDVLFLPDVSRFGTIIENLKCDIESDVHLTLNLGTITLEAKSNKEVV